MDMPYEWMSKRNLGAYMKSGYRWFAVLATGLLAVDARPAMVMF
jgi:hypothetical protein